MNKKSDTLEPQQGVRGLSHETLGLVALIPMLAVRLFQDGASNGGERLVLLLISFAAAWIWSCLWARRMRLPDDPSIIFFALLITVMVPEPAELVGAFVAASFGWIFGHLIFGGKPLLPPALLALSFGTYSFPDAGYQVLSVLDTEPNMALLLSCLPGVALMLWADMFPIRFVIGACAGAALVILLTTDPGGGPTWSHFALGSFSVGIVFFGLPGNYLPVPHHVRWLQGGLVGALIILFRNSDPTGPDGIIAAALLGGLFAPLLAQAMSRKTAHE